MILYFTRPLHGTPCRRYYLLSGSGRTVVAVQVSRPDGVEIAEPATVRLRLLQPAHIAIRARGRDWQDIDDARAKLRRCSRCNEHKRRDQFRMTNSGRLESWCRACALDYKRSKREKVRS